MLKSIQTYAFRNLEDREVDCSAREVCLVGNNGQGKSNFLEAIYFLSYASSFRGARDSDLIRFGEEACSVIGKIDLLDCETMRVSVEAGKKAVFHGNKCIRDRKALLDLIPVIIFSHNDLDYVCGPPEKRRWFFDQIASLGSPAYIDSLRTFKKILKSRNTLIREGKISLLDVLDIQFAQAGLEVQEARKVLLEGLSRDFSTQFAEVSGIKGVEISYRPSWRLDSFDKVLDLLKTKRESDIALGYSSSGPHRDRWEFSHENRNFLIKASTGQRRLLALLLRISQALWYMKKTGREPIYLLDDVLLELDGEKKQSFFTLLPHYAQAFFTFLPEENLSYFKANTALIYQVNNGKLSL